MPQALRRALGRLWRRLHVAEVVSLKVGNVDSERMLIRVERGKGGRSRHALLSADLLALLRAWWQEGRRDGVTLPAGWLFPGQHVHNLVARREIDALRVGNLVRFRRKMWRHTRKPNAAPACRQANLFPHQASLPRNGCDPLLRPVVGRRCRTPGFLLDGRACAGAPLPSLGRRGF
jgi:integrase